MLVSMSIQKETSPKPLKSKELLTPRDERTLERKEAFASSYMVPHHEVEKIFILIASIRHTPRNVAHIFQVHGVHFPKRNGGHQQAFTQSGYIMA